MNYRTPYEKHPLTASPPSDSSCQKSENQVQFIFGGEAVIWDPQQDFIDFGFRIASLLLALSRDTTLVEPGFSIASSIP